MGNALQVTRLTLTNFRNYPALRLEPGSGPVVLTGENGAGKTNLLEAVSLLVPGRGLRGAGYGDVASVNSQGGWGLAADVSGPHGDASIGTGWTPPEPGSVSSSRQVRIDGEPARSTAVLARLMRIVWITPAMDRLFTGPAGDRRRFLDRLVAAFDNNHGTRVQSLERVIRQRNKLLDEASPDESWLNALEDQIAGDAVAVAAARNAAIDLLSTYIERDGGHGGSAAFPWCELAIAGELELGLRQSPAVQIEDNYRMLLTDSRHLDRAAGRLLRGPHRSDFEVTHGPKQMPAKIGSTGEQKALLIGIVLAHARAVQAQFSGFAPILLLDEVAAHLDAIRRKALFAEINRLGAQAWMTGTDAALFDDAGEGASRYTVDNGAIAMCGKN